MGFGARALLGGTITLVLLLSTAPSEAQTKEPVRGKSTERSGTSQSWEVIVGSVWADTRFDVAISTDMVETAAAEKKTADEKSTTVLLRTTLTVKNRQQRKVEFRVSNFTMKSGPSSAKPSGYWSKGGVPRLPCHG